MTVEPTPEVCEKPATRSSKRSSRSEPAELKKKPRIEPYEIPQSYELLYHTEKQVAEAQVAELVFAQPHCRDFAGNMN